MIPVRLTLRNFMCYRDNVPPIDFRGIHTACLCGDNGSGKSALVDAITWALWGESRARDQDDLVHQGQQEMRVELEFEARANLYRVIRQHARPGLRRSSQTDLEFQLYTSEGFKSIRGNSLRETQQKIIHTLRMDYDTFVNSAFLRQGHADEFTVKPPGQRKEVLANILSLSFYEKTKEKAKEYARERARDQEKLEREVQEISREVQRRGEYEAEREKISQELTALGDEVERLKSRLVALERERKALELKREQQAEREKSITEREEELKRWQGIHEEHRRQVEEYEKVLRQRPEIEEGYIELEKARKEYEEFNNKARESTLLERRKGQLEGQVNRAREELIAQQMQWQGKAQELKKRSQQRATREEELRQAGDKLRQLAPQEEELRAKRQQREEMAARSQQLQAAGEQAQQEIKELAEKLTLLQQGDARCPLCYTLLGAPEKKRLEEKYQGEIQAKVSLQQEHHREKKDREREGESLEKEIWQRELQVKELTAEAGRVRSLEEKVKECQEEAAQLISAQSQAYDLSQRLANGEFALEAQQSLREAQQQLTGLGYDALGHQEAGRRCHDLERFDSLKRRVEEAEKLLASRKAQGAQAEEVIARLGAALERDRQIAFRLERELSVLPGLIARLKEAEQAYCLGQQRQAEKQQALGAARQSLTRLEELERLGEEKRKSLRQADEEREVYEALEKAFGKEGIQAFLIESVLPEIETEATQLLSRMTQNRMHLKLETQRQYKSRKGTEETLDIIVSDELGTRSYEMYSGGEAFRINFALRIALSRLLAKRAGAPLPTLVVDEGFGTQDKEGLDHLVEAIKSVEGDFEKIIVITHIEEMKEAFPIRLAVTKTERGSLISLS